MRISCDFRDQVGIGTSWVAVPVDCQLLAIQLSGNQGYDGGDNAEARAQAVVFASLAGSPNISENEVDFIDASGVLATLDLTGYATEYNGVSGNIFVPSIDEVIFRRGDKIFLHGVAKDVSPGAVTHPRIRASMVLQLKPI